MKKILVIDDDGPFRATVTAALRRGGHEVLDAGDGAEGLALSFAHRPNLVLSDVQMAGRNGFELLKELRAHPETLSIPVILMTGEPQQADARYSMDQGADDYLQKPFAMEEMLAAVQARLQRQAGVEQSVAAAHHAERSMAREESRLQTLALEAAANGIAITDHRGRMLWVNPAFTKLTGYSAGEAIGQNLRLLKSGQHSPKFYADLWVTIATGNTWHGELVNKRKNGSLYFEEMTITPVCGAKGEIQNFVAIKQDVSERKQMEQVLAHERDLLQALMDNLPDLIYFKDVNSRFTRINRALASHLGLARPEDAIGQSDAEFFPMSQAQQKLVDERRLLATGTPILGLVEKSDTAKGTKWVSSTKVPIVGDEGKITGLVGVSHDITGRKQSEEALIESKRFLQSTLDALSSHIAILDEHGTIIEVNAAWKRFARENDYLGNHGVGDNYLNVCTAVRGGFSEEAPTVADGIRTVMTGQSREFHLEYPCHSPQEQRWFVVRATRFDGAGPVRVVVAHENISERKRAEESLRLLSSALEQARESIVITDAELDLPGPKIVFVNPAYTQMTGYTAQEAIGRTPRLSQGPRTDRAVLRRLRQNLERGEPFQGETINYRKDGSEFNLEWQIAPLLNASGKTTHFVAIQRDITQRKLLEAQMERLRTEYSVVLNALGEGVHWIDVAGRIKFENPAAAKMLGYGIAELIGQPAHLTMHHTRANGSPYPQSECPIFATLRDGVVRRVSDEVFWRKDGTSFAVEYICSPVYEQDGAAGGTVVIFTDVTERKLLESQLFQAQKLETVGQLAAGIAHEINTPTQYVGDNTRFVKDSFTAISQVLHAHEELLAAARLNTITPELLARHEAMRVASDLDYLREQIPSALNETLEGVERVSKIVRAMKDFSHPGGREKKPADLNRAIESTTTVARNEWKYVADLELELAPDLPLVPCFLGEFNQCVLNLIVNAAHAIGDVVKTNPGTKGRITVRTRREGDQVEIRVADTGTGIPEAARPKIFEPFFTTKDVGKGTGQGLSILYGSIVKRHGGTVTFETEVGQGTTFIIRLPISPPAKTEASSSPTEGVRAV